VQATDPRWKRPQQLQHWPHGIPTTYRVNLHVFSSSIYHHNHRTNRNYPHHKTFRNRGITPLTSSLYTNNPICSYPATPQVKSRPWNEAHVYQDGLSSWSFLILCNPSFIITSFLTITISNNTCCLQDTRYFVSYKLQLKLRKRKCCPTPFIYHIMQVIKNKVLQFINHNSPLQSHSSIIEKGFLLLNI